MYLIFNVQTKIIAQANFGTEAAAKTSLRARVKRFEKRIARAKSEGNKRYAEQLANELASFKITTLEEYNATQRKTKIVRNLMSGKEIEIDINTPASCDPSTETYWSM